MSNSILEDTDGNIFNVKLTIKENKLFATWEGEEDKYYIDLNKDIINIILKG